MKAFVVLVLVLSMSVKYVDSTMCVTKPVAEGSTYTLTLFTTSNQAIIRFRNVHGLDIAVTDCDMNRDVPCEMIMDDADLSSEMTYSVADGKNTLKLNIGSINRLRDNTTVSWTYGDETVQGQCGLPVYSFPSNPVCQDIGFSDEGKTVSWTCTVNRVYPDMACRFEYREGNNGEFALISHDFESQRTTDVGQYPPRTTYHDYTCTLELPIEKLGGPGIYQFQLKAVVMSGSTDLETKQSNKEVSLVYPQVELSNCPDGYIKEGDNTKTCQCSLNAGNPPGKAQWVDSAGNIIGQVTSSDVSSLALSYNPDDKSPTYICEGISALGGGNWIIYMPKFAYGPTIITISLHSNSDTLTYDSETPFYADCDVPIGSVNPGIVVSVTASDDSIIEKQTDYETEGFYRHTFKIFPKIEGSLTLKCLAHNTEFSDLKTHDSQTITIQAPPCDCGWRLSAEKDTCVKVIGKKMSFSRAREYCIKTMKGDLITSVTSWTQRSIVTKQVKYGTQFWIGVHSPSFNGIYEYVNQNLVDGRGAFKKGRPKSTSKNYCVSMKKRRWFDKKCWRRLRFACQKTANVN